MSRRPCHDLETLYARKRHFSVTAFKALFPSLPQYFEHLDGDPGGPSAIKPVYRQSRFGATTFHVLNQILQYPNTGDIRQKRTKRGHEDLSRQKAGDSSRGCFVSIER
jgi:hypothetical protein